MKIRSLIALALASCIAHGNAWAIPEGGLVVRGSAIFDPRGNVLTITNTPGTIINWPGFSIGAGEVARFVQQDSSSAVLNRITGQDPSQILGALQSNGRVFLVNPNGIVFGAGARVDVNGLVASTLDIGNDNFAAGRHVFDAASGRAGAIRNDGTITTPNGGRVYLIAPSIENNGLISSPRGEVMLAAGHHVELVDSASPALQVVVSAPADRAVNLGRIVSEGGSIGIYGAIVNQRGLVSADSAVRGEDGRIVFRASGETLLDAGSVTSARGADHGGNIQVLGDHVGITGDALVDASGQRGGGTVLVGGDFHGANPDVGNASATYVGAQATIRADAIESGDGGRVAVWSDGATRAYGHISARGGEQSGNGGFAEVSGRNYLDYGARADLLAPRGTAGTLLLDPNDITIQAGPISGSNVPASSPPVIYSGGTGSSIITVSDLQASLGLGSVTISTAGGTGGPNGGTITVASPVAWNGTLRLDAANGIAINGALSSPADGFLYLTSGGTITQTAPIGVTYLIINSLGDVVLDSAANTVYNLAAHVGDPSHLNHNFRFVNAGPLSVFNFNGVNGISIDVSGGYSSGAPDGVISLRAMSGDITQTSGSILSAKAVYAQAASVILTEANAVGTVAGQSSSITGFAFTSAGPLDAGTVAGASGIQAPGAGANLTAAGAITGTISADNVTLTAGSGISVTTQTSRITATSTAGNIVVTNAGALITDDVVTPGAITVSTHSPLTVAGPLFSSGGGAITLSAGPTGSVTDQLTINGSVSSTGPILLRAGDSITVNGTIVGTVTQQPFLNIPVLPTLSACIANPALVGCSAVLPTVNQCVATPTLTGCSIVLPSLSQCVATPLANGCSAVLPSLATCTATPTLAGCSVVLPFLSQCVANPTLAGCSAVLPSLATCTAAPTLAGCSAVLPTLAQCTVAPALAGCSAVLPTIAQCTATPGLAGCGVLLPTIAQCIASPTTAGCSAILPGLASCVTSPSTPGCSAVLPTLSQCVTTPSAAGCGTVLPTLAQCTGSPTLQGCSVVLPPIATCAATPSAAGCQVVLPPISTQTQANTPISQVLNTIVNVINTSINTVNAAAPSDSPLLWAVVAATRRDPPTGVASSGTDATNPTTATTTATTTTTADTKPADKLDEKKDEKKDDKKDVAATDKVGVKNDDAAKKMYCN